MPINIDTATSFARFVATLARECPTSSIEELLNAAHQLRRIAKQVRSYNVAASNRETTVAEEQGNINRLNKAKWVCDTIGIRRVLTDGDPRGPAILVGLPSGLTNDFRKRGYIVPE